MWCLIDNFSDLIKEWWDWPHYHGCGAFILAKKITHIRDYLKRWARIEFGSIKLKKLALLHDLDKFDLTRESRPLTMAENANEINLKKEMGLILKQEEVYWKQRSRVTWLREGDENTRFFHAVANGRRNRN